MSSILQRQYPNTTYSSTQIIMHGFSAPSSKRDSLMRPTTSYTQNAANSTSKRPNMQLKASLTSRELRSSMMSGPFLPGKSFKHKNMKTLVLDMDETLLRASATPVVQPDCIVTLSDGVKFYCIKRPYLDQFLERMSKMYEIVIYTSGEKEYATTVINEVDPNRYISYILHRDHCLHAPYGLDKDLSLIGRDLKEVIFIDNLEENMKRQRENGIKILDFYSNRRDDELNKLIPFLEYASTLEDVRPIRKLLSDFNSTKAYNQYSSQQKQRSESAAPVKSDNGSSSDNKKAYFESEYKTSTTNEERFNKTTQIFGTSSFVIPSQRLFYTPDNKSSKIKFISSPREEKKGLFLSRFEDKVNHLKGGRPTYNSGDLVNPDMETAPENIKKANAWKANLYERNPKVWEPIYEGSSINATDKSNAESRFQNIKNSNSAMSPLLDDLYERINALEEKLKAKKFHINRNSLV